MGRKWLDNLSGGGSSRMQNFGRLVRQKRISLTGRCWPPPQPLFLSFACSLGVVGPRRVVALTSTVTCYYYSASASTSLGTGSSSPPPWPSIPQSPPPKVKSSPAEEDLTVLITLHRSLLLLASASLPAAGHRLILFPSMAQPPTRSSSKGEEFPASVHTAVC